MNQRIIKENITDFLKLAGVEVNGDEPWDIKIHNEHFFSRVVHGGSLALGESYMEDWWDCKRIDQFFERIIKANVEQRFRSRWWLLFKLALFKFLNRQTKKRAMEVGKKHYDLGNKLFKMMLDEQMNYTCGYWKNANDLHHAQINKLELVCQKLLLSPGMRVLDIGCGFGGFAAYAAKHYDVNVVGITISKEQCDYAQQYCAHLPVEIRFQDYRDLHETFDRVVSMGMFEHVGHLNYHHYMQVVHNNLKDDGLFLLHTIGSNTSNVANDEWMSKYIFPNSALPSISQIAASIEELFVMEDWHNFGADYDKTLMAWYVNFEQGWNNLKEHYDHHFYRMWRYYLLSCAGLFRARYIQLWQIVLSKHGIKGGYQSLR